MYCSNIVRDKIQIIVWDMKTHTLSGIPKHILCQGYQNTYFVRDSKTHTLSGIPKYKVVWNTKLQNKIHK